MILHSHRDGNEGAIFSTDQGRRESEAHRRGRASKQAREKEGGRETGEKNHYFLCVTAVGASKLKQGEGSNRKEETRREEWRKKRSTATPGSRRNPSQVGRRTHRWPQYKPTQSHRLFLGFDSWGLGPEILWISSIVVRNGDPRQMSLLMGCVRQICFDLGVYCSSFFPSWIWEPGKSKHV